MHPVDQNAEQYSGQSRRQISGTLRENDTCRDDPEDIQEIKGSPQSTGDIHEGRDQQEIKKDLETNLKSLVFSPMVQEEITDRKNVSGDNQAIEEREREKSGRAKLNDDSGYSKSGNDDQPQENEPKNIFSSLQYSIPSFGDTYSMKFLNSIFLSYSFQFLLRICS
jgi:hypothetical protein